VELVVLSDVVVVDSLVDVLVVVVLRAIVLGAEVGEDDDDVDDGELAVLCVVLEVEVLVVDVTVRTVWFVVTSTMVSL